MDGPPIDVEAAQPPQELPPDAAGAAAASTLSPTGLPEQQTVYINNLSTRIKIPELKKALHAMFSQFGKILDVLAGRGPSRKGQAWIVFAEQEAANNALTKMQGFPFYEKPMRLNFAKDKSDAIAKSDGSFKPRERAEKETKKKKAASGKGSSKKSKVPVMLMLPTGQMVPAPAGMDMPNKTLFVQQLPEETTDVMLGMLFRQFPGFKEVRMVPGKPGIAFVDFEAEAQSAVAMQQLQNFRISPQHVMQISFAKR
eukprot:tig00021537_g22280.t1